MATTIGEFFEQIPDPRVERTRKHELVEIIVISVLATICGADSWHDIADFGREREDLLRGSLKLPHGIPAPDTFRRVFAALDVEAFGEAFAVWTRSLCETTKGKLIALDGKTLRGSFTAAAKQDARHVVSAWVGENHIVLGQVSTDAKSNEITAIPKLLDMLDVRGATITIDAMGCQKKIVEKIREKGADYAIGVKDNQPTLRKEVEAAFTTLEISGEDVPKHGIYESKNKGHGRKETRRVTAIDADGWLSAEVSTSWSSLKSIVRVESNRSVKGKTTSETRYYVSSLPPHAEVIGRAIREHWGIENGQHWTLDMAFDEDRSRTRRKNAPDNLALLRRIALNILKQASNKSSNGKHLSVRSKRLKAGWSDRYLEELLRMVGSYQDGDKVG